MKNVNVGSWWRCGSQCKTRCWLGSENTGEPGAAVRAPHTGQPRSPPAPQHISDDHTVCHAEMPAQLITQENNMGTNVSQVFSVVKSKTCRRWQPSYSRAAGIGWGLPGLPAPLADVTEQRDSAAGIRTPVFPVSHVSG